MQLFILLYIEGGSYIQEEEDQWEFVVLLGPFPVRVYSDLSHTQV